MSVLRAAFIRNFVLFILIAMVGVLSLMLYDLSKTKQQLAASFISKPQKTISVEMRAFFSPIKNVLKIAVDHGTTGHFRAVDTASVNNYFAPYLSLLPQISSMSVADKHGYQHDLIRTQDEWRTRTIRYGSNDRTSHWARLSWPMLDVDSTWTTNIQMDPRTRPWHNGAMEHPGFNHWTAPYVFNTTHKSGITVSCAYVDHSVADSMAILALDLTLNDLFAFTSAVRISENGFGLILTHDREFIEQPIEDADLQYSTQAIEMLQERRGSANEWASFKFEKNDEIWWAQFSKLEVDDNYYFIVGVVLPEKDIMTEVVRSQHVIYLGMGTTILFMIMLFFTHQQIARANRLLAVSNKKIREQNIVTQRNNNNILDSIQYAKNLQRAMLPAFGIIRELIPNSFIFYEPKDVVSGDFYWIKDRGRTIYFTVADCTGHGVPGAFMSIMGMDLLKEGLSSNEVTSPARLLTTVREELIDRLVSDEMQTRDGMDMALCSFNTDTHVLKFAGAMNNLFLVRPKGGAAQLNITSPKGNISMSCHTETDTHRLFILRGDRIPISYTYAGQFTQFSEYSLKILPKDIVYLTSDGFADQFGGEKGKKFGQKRFRNLLFSLQSIDIKSQEEEMRRVLKDWKKNEEQVDDICVMGIQFID